ncbi:hypothetical protein TCAL_16746 [Tigriopus californicus]|uniref:Uncharacterized protein n=1 Tax=Tigriopus californicus TaxID=6832 RepID=A0A553PSG7_TIGCA|nr:hypothetical protein TCAL_16746 [Tigriopus californicus]
MTFHVYLLAFSILEISTHSLNSTPDIVIVREPEITLHCANDFHRLSPITEWFLTAKWSTIDIQGLESLTWSQNTSVDYQDLDISMKAGPHATNFTECLEISTLNENQDMKLKFLPIADCMVFLESPSDLHLTATCVQNSSKNLSSIQAFDLQLNSDFLFNWESLLK